MARFSLNDPLVANLHILVVDDEPLVLELLRVWLEGDGFRVSTRSEALGTTAFVLRAQPDVVILDVEMPGMNGNQLVRLLRYHPSTSHVKTLLHSSKNVERLEALGRAAGANAVVPKGTDRVAFLDAIYAVTADPAQRPSQAAAQ